MEMTPAILRAKVMHRRVLPRVNAFTYNIYYLAFPLDALDRLADGWRFGVNAPGLMGFRARDHGDGGGDLRGWINSVLAAGNCTRADGEVVLVTMPRLFGYVFNPVSFWLCHDQSGLLRAVVCEVNNTFGERHCYLCAHEDGRAIEGNETLTAQKVFHVSPFLEREGYYRFRFTHTPKAFGAFIDLHDNDGSLRLQTALTGTLQPYNRHTRRRAFWGVPLVTLRAIFLIHWQALKILAKGIKYIRKPLQLAQRVSRTTDKIT